MFYELMRRRGPFCFYAFDLLWLDGSDLRDRPLFERKKLLRKLLQRHPKSVLYVEHVATGTDLFRVICDRDMEGVVAKQASARYTPEATTWVKIKNRILLKAFPGSCRLALLKPGGRESLERTQEIHRRSPTAIKARRKSRPSPPRVLAGMAGRH
jgi:hypothetical protein